MKLLPLGGRVLLLPFLQYLVCVPQCLKEFCTTVVHMYGSKEKREKNNLMRNSHLRNKFVKSMIAASYPMKMLMVCAVC